MQADRGLATAVIGLCLQDQILRSIIHFFHRGTTAAMAVNCRPLLLKSYRMDSAQIGS